MSGVPNEVGRAMELGHVVNQGIRRSDPEAWATWISDPRTPDIVGRFLALGPERALIRLTGPVKLEAMLRMKAEALGLPITSADLEFAIQEANFRGASSYCFPVGYRQLHGALEQLGIQFRNLVVWEHQAEETVRALDPGPTAYPLTSEEFYELVRQTEKLTQAEQELKAAKLGGRIAFLIEVLDFYLDVCLRGQLLGLSAPQMLKDYRTPPGPFKAFISLRCADKDRTESRYYIHIQAFDQSAYILADLLPGDNPWEGYGVLIRR